VIQVKALSCYFYSYEYAWIVEQEESSSFPYFIRENAEVNYSPPSSSEE